MQAFKAANPRCVLEDMRKWWEIEKGRGEGESVASVRNRGEPEVPASEEGEGSSDRPGYASAPLSSEEEELWVMLWANTLPVPASQQKPLFDAEREANETLDALDATPPSELIRHLLLAVAEGAVACLRTSPLFGLLSDESKREASALVRTARQLHANHCKPRGARTHLLLTGF